jgi:hypothetical protein
MSIGSSSSVGTTLSLVHAAEDDTDKSAKLIKKSLQGEKDLVSTLLPQSGGLDIRA